MRRVWGQATVELALCSLVFVTVIVFGIHFAELGTMKLRVQQAAAFATWQAAGDRAHRFRQGSWKSDPDFLNANQLRNAGGLTPEAATAARYGDLEPLGGSGRRESKAAMTRSSNLQVRCDPKRVAVPLNQTKPIERLAAGYDFPLFGGSRVDGVGCSVQARIQLFRSPAAFVDGPAGFFNERQIWRPSVNVCAIGRAARGVCKGQIPMAIDDWGLQGDQGGESEECGFDCSLHEKGGKGANNVAYKQTIERLYQKYADVRWVKNHWTIENFVKELFSEGDPSIMEVVPVDERDFRFAFIGDRDEDPFKITTKEIDGPGFGTGFGPNKPMDFKWATTPYSEKYQKAYQARGNCFAGLPCDRNPFDKQSW